MENTSITNNIMDTKLGDLFINSTNSLVEILEEITKLWSIKKNKSEIDFSTKIYNIFNVNLVNVCIFINHCLEILKDTKLTITGFGSISAIRGRSRNSTYAAAKRGLESYFESLRHAEAESEITIQFYLLGYLKTNLTFGEETVGPKPVEVDKLATEVFDNISKDFGMKFYPRVWIPLMMAFRFMPWEFFRRIKF